MEKEIVSYYENFEKKQLEAMKAKGKRLIEIEGADQYLKLSLDEAWKMVNKACPESGPKMEAMIRK